MDKNLDNHWENCIHNKKAPLVIVLFYILSKLDNTRIIV